MAGNNPIGAAGAAGGLASAGRRKLLLLRARPVAWFCFALAALFLIVAWLGPKPWDAEAAKRFALEKPRPEDFASLVFFWIALGNAAVCVLLALSARWWGQPLSLKGHSGGAPYRGRWEMALFWSALFLVAGGAVALRLPLASKSLWWDEIWTVKNAVSGYREIRDDGEERFTKRNWARTFWQYSKPTNHAGFSVLSRCSVEVWRAFSGAPRWACDEVAFRLPSILAGAGSVLLIGWLARDVFGSITGLGCAVLLAAHPWFIRYSVDGRAFGLTVFFLLVAWLATRGLLGAGAGWGWWILYGVAMLMLMWVFPFNVYVPLGLGASSVAGLLLLKNGSDRWRALGRFVVVNVLAGLVFLQLAGPWIPQALNWKDVEGEDMAGPVISQRLLVESWYSFATGLPSATERRDQPLPSIASETAAHVWFKPFVFWVMPGLAILGFASVAGVALFRPGERGATPPRIALCLLGGTLLALGLALVVAWWKQHYYYDRYVIYALPALVLAIGAGVWALTAFIKPRAAAAVTGWTLLTGFFLAATHGQRAVLIERPIAPIREVAHFVANAGREPHAALVGYGLGGDTPAMYEPRIRGVFDPASLLAELEQARTSNRELILFYGYNSFNRGNTERNARDAFVYLDDAALFEPLAEFRGIEDQFTYRIFRYTGVDPTLRIR